MKVVDIKDFENLSRFFKGKLGRWFVERFMRLTALDKVNQVYEQCCEYSGSEFSSRLLNELGVDYRIGNAERLGKLPEGAFITVSNHPYGGLDGIITIDMMTKLRPDYKFMVNKILSYVKSMKQNFISVTPTGNIKNGVSLVSLKGIRETLMHLKNGHPVGFFPSGAVSDFSIKDMRVRDRSWQKGILKLIHSVKVPVLPIRFFDKNSMLFYFLGTINWKIRLLRMPHELFNKTRQKPRVGIGELISVEQKEKFSDVELFSAFLRDAVYGMPLPTSYVSCTAMRTNNQLKIS